MGTVTSIERGDGKRAVKHNKEIDDALKHEKMKESATVKLLLLGPAESGKSTFAKQMKLLHENGFTDEERQSYRGLMYCNVLENTVTIIDAMLERKIALTTEQAKKDTEAVKTSYRQVTREMLAVQREMLEAVARLRHDPGFVECLTRAHEYQLNDSTQYYYNSLERLMAPDYVATDQDILRSRLRTTGLIETNFTFKGFMFRMVDVGGQRSERRKWIHCFDNVTAIIFAASLSEYDQVLREDSQVNRMHESLLLFSSILKQDYFVKTTVILLLNKKDIFEQKIKKYPLNICFPEYTGENSYDEASEYIQEKYEECKPPGRDLYIHRTNATDTNNINVVFEASMASVLRKNLEETGLF